MRSITFPTSPAFLLMRSGAHVRMPLYLPSFNSSTISLKTGRWPVSFAECDSRFIQTTSNPSRSASWSISLIWLSMERICRSSLSVDFLAYRQYFTNTGACTCLVGNPVGAIAVLLIPTQMTQTRPVVQTAREPESTTCW